MQRVLADQVADWSGRLIDVRTREEFEGERLARAECVPLDGLMHAAASWDMSEHLLVMCKSGMRSARAAKQLRRGGFTNVARLEGGIKACKKAGVEVIGGRRRLSIAAQVMVASGLLLLLGLLLSQIHPWFIGIDWLVAAGLVASGLTGACPMARFLGMMPWNQQGCDTTNSTSCTQGA